MEKKETKGRARPAKKPLPTKGAANDLALTAKQAKGVKGGYIFKPLDKMTPK